MSHAIPTERQRQVLRFIEGSRLATGEMPTFAQIAQGIGVASTATAFKHVAALRKKGVLPEATRPYHRAER